MVDPLAGEDVAPEPIRNDLHGGCPIRVIERMRAEGSGPDIRQTGAERDADKGGATFERRCPDGCYGIGYGNGSEGFTVPEDGILDGREPDILSESHGSKGGATVECSRSDLFYRIRDVH